MNSFSLTWGVRLLLVFDLVIADQEMTALASDGAKGSARTHTALVSVDFPMFCLGCFPIKEDAG